MIKIIKDGKLEKFTKTCSDCGCVFEYELVDLKKEYDYSMVLTSYPSQYRYIRYVECPCCGHKIVHDTGCEVVDNTLTYPKVIYTTNTSGELSCEDCLYYQKIKLNPEKQYEVGDTPCTWCPKMQPKCISE